MRKVVAAALAIFTFAAFFGCGKDKKAESVKEVSLEEISSLLLESEIWSEQLTEVDPEIGIAVYELSAEDIAEAYFYMSTGATAEELAVIKAVGSENADNIKAAIENRIMMQSQSYASYAPAEVPKLENANLKISSDIIVFCVSGDSAAAQELIDSLI